MSFGDPLGHGQIGWLEPQDLPRGYLRNTCDSQPFRVPDGHPHPSIATCSLDIFSDIDRGVCTTANSYFPLFHQQTEVASSDTASCSPWAETWLIVRGFPTHRRVRVGTEEERNQMFSTFYENRYVEGLGLREHSQPTDTCLTSYLVEGFWRVRFHMTAFDILL